MHTKFQAVNIKERDGERDQTVILKWVLRNRTMLSGSLSPGQGAAPSCGWRR
jgi:hypothetical protein